MSALRYSVYSADGGIALRRLCFLWNRERLAGIPIKRKTHIVILSAAKNLV